MESINQIYKKLGHDEEVVFQTKNKNIFDKIIKELIPIFKRSRDSDNYIFLEDIINYRNAYFILGAWRDGMFQLSVGKEWTIDYRVKILADHKESPMDNYKHRNQIEDIIKILDKYRAHIVKKKLSFDKDFNLVFKK